MPDGRPSANEISCGRGDLSLARGNFPEKGVSPQRKKNFRFPPPSAKSGRMIDFLRQLWGFVRPYRGRVLLRRGWWE